MRALIVLSCLLVGCSSLCTSVPVERLIVKHEYIAAEVPLELLTIPPQLPVPGATATDKDLALWLLDNERRTLELEQKLRHVRALYEEQTAAAKRLSGEHR